MTGRRLPHGTMTDGMCGFDVRRIGQYLDELARSMRRAEWLAADLDHHRSSTAVEQAAAGLQLESRFQLHVIENCLRFANLPMPGPVAEVHTPLPPAPDGLF